jgi:hypothetical protein
MAIPEPDRMRLDNGMRARPLIAAGAYGMAFGMLVGVVFATWTESPVLRVIAGLLAVVLYVATARGRFARWMSPADRIIAGGPLTARIGGPGRQPWTPANITYVGSFYAGAGVSMIALAAWLTPAEPSVIGWTFLVVGMLAIGDGALRRPFGRR